MSDFEVIDLGDMPVRTGLDLPKLPELPKECCICGSPRNKPCKSRSGRSMTMKHDDFGVFLRQIPNITDAQRVAMLEAMNADKYQERRSGKG